MLSQPSSSPTEFDYRRWGWNATILPKMHVYSTATTQARCWTLSRDHVVDEELDEGNFAKKITSIVSIGLPERSPSDELELTELKVYTLENKTTQSLFLMQVYVSLRINQGSLCHMLNLSVRNLERPSEIPTQYSLNAAASL